jgi:spermidine synthase
MTQRLGKMSMFIMFFASGAAGLTYQVVWSRLFNEVFGVSAYAVTAVLAAFLGGLALGSWALGRVADRMPEPLRLYGWLEVGIGLTAVAGTWLLAASDPVDAWLASRLAPSSGLLLLARVGLASAVILPPTFFMGGTLPAMTRSFVGSVDRLGRELGFLYALNTAGAVVGSLAAGFVLIRALGVHSTLWLAVGVNLVIGGLALRLSSMLGARPVAEARPDGGDAPAEGAGTGWMVSMGASGLASLALEVLWTRELVLVLGTSTYAFVTMLSTFLVGIALGSYLARGFLDRIQSPRLVFGWIQVAIAASTLLSIPSLAYLLAHQAWMEGQDPSWVTFTAARFGASFLVMIVPTTLIGMTFPVAAKGWAGELRTLGRRLGQLYGANTAGNILGALVGGFILLPTFGLQRSIALLALLNLGAASWALLRGRGAASGWARLRREAVPALVFLGCAATLLAWQPRPFTSTEESPDDTTLYYREGLVSTVKVLQRASYGDQRWMMVDGVRIGQSHTGVDAKQQVLAHLPFLLMPQRPPRFIASVGLGTGILVGEVGQHEGVQGIECLELSPPVIEGARYFADFNHGAMDDPRIRVVNDDGINYLRRSRERYDAIIADGKSRSGHAGNGAFYSDEYFRYALAHLAPDGVMIQWVPLDVPVEDLRIIYRTFMAAFPYGYLWLGPSSSYLVGTRQPLVLDFAHMQRQLDSPAYEGMRRHGWDHAADVASLLIADKPALAPWLAKEGAINSFEHPVIEFYSLLGDAAPEAEREARNLGELSTLRTNALETVRLVGADPRSMVAHRQAVSQLLAGLAVSPRVPLGEARLDQLESAVMPAPDDGVVGQWAATMLFQIAYSLDSSGQTDEAAGIYRRALRVWPTFVEALDNLGRDLALAGHTQEAGAIFRQSLSINPQSRQAHSMLGQILEMGGDLPGAIDQFRAAVRLAPSSPPLHGELGASLAAAGRLDEAIVEFRADARLEPKNAMALSRLAYALVARPGATAADKMEATALAASAGRMSGGRDPAVLERLAAVHASQGHFTEAIEAERQALAIVSSTANQQVVREMTSLVEQYERARESGAR